MNRNLIGCQALLACLTLVFAGAPAPAQTASKPPAPRPANQPVRVTVKTRGNELAIGLIGRKGNELLYQVEGTSEGKVSLNADAVDSAYFDLKYDDEQLQKAVRGMNWAQAAGILLPAVSPTLPYLDLKDNNAVPLVLDTGSYLMKAAAVKTAGGLPRKPRRAAPTSISRPIPC